MLFKKNTLAENVILIDQYDQMIGTMDKLQAHCSGKLHRAFSIFIFNSSGELLLQQRAFEKYHSGGKWTNTCCSHPQLGEDTEAAAHRRLREEMGMQCTLSKVFCFTYRAVVDNGLIENEIDHVFFGQTDDLPRPNDEEVAAVRYVTMTELETDIRTNPSHYTAWLKICFDLVKLNYRNYETNRQFVRPLSINKN